MSERSNPGRSPSRMFLHVERTRTKGIPNWDIVALGIIYVALLVGFLNVVYQGLAGVALSIAAALIASRNSRTWATFMVASQIAPDPARSPLTLAQLGVCAWLILKSWRLRRSQLILSARFLQLCAPFCIWMGICAAVDMRRPDIETWLGVIVGAITLSYAPLERDFVRVASEALILGSSLVATSYVLVLGGFAVVTTKYTQAVAVGSSELYQRVGFGRADSNLTAITCSVFVAGLVAWWVAYSRRAVLATAVTAAGVVLSSALLMDTYARSGIYAFVIGLVGVAIFARNCRLSLRPSLPAITSSVLITLALLAVSHSAVKDRLSSYWDQIQRRDRQDEIYRRTGAEAGILAGRSDVWLTHARLMIEYPITGVRRGTIVDFGGYGVTKVGEMGIWAAAHNVVLEMGSRCGVPGALLFLYFLLYIPIRVMRAKLRPSQIPALAMYSTCLVLFMAFSIGGMKSFWVCAAVLFASIMPEHARVRFVYIPSRRAAVQGRDVQSPTVDGAEPRAAL